MKRVPAWQRAGQARWAVAILALGGWSVVELWSVWACHPPAAQRVGLRINPATELAADWRWASGVGPVLAARIHAAGREHPFESAEDLRGVNGVGPVLVDRLAHQAEWERSP